MDEAHKFVSDVSSYNIGHTPVLEFSAMSSSNSEGRQCEDSPPLKLTKMDAYIMRLNKQQLVRDIAQPQESALDQLNDFLRSTGSSDLEIDAIEFWNLRQTIEKYPDLHRLASQVFCVPATSAPVERIFSQSGIILHPHRSRLSAKMVETLLFLKCNEHAVSVVDFM